MATAARFDGAGNLSIQVDKLGTQSGSATFAGAGSLSANVTAAQQISAQFNGAGAFQPMRLRCNNWRHGLTVLAISASPLTATMPYAIQVRFVGAGNVSVDSIKYKFAAATFSGLGNLSVAYSIVKYAEARFDGASLRCQPERYRGKVLRQSSGVKGSCEPRLLADVGRA